MFVMYGPNKSECFWLYVLDGFQIFREKKLKWPLPKKQNVLWCSSFILIELVALY